MKRRYLGSAISFFSAVGYAGTLGDLAIQWVEIAQDMHGLIKVICWVAGGGLILGGLIRYQRHRANPRAVLLSASVSFIVAGCGLLLLTLIPMVLKP